MAEIENAPCCEKAEFEARVIVQPRIANRKKLCAMVEVRCKRCKRRYRFEGLVRGVFGGDEPSTPDFTGSAAILPIVPFYVYEQRALDKVSPWHAGEPDDEPTPGRTLTP
jgi:hypothetical protein